ncbi:MAG: transcription termination factor Rho [Burkholderiales bacterium]|nr:transcription termination factor Rho [Opitutaceae bacterium]
MPVQPAPPALHGPVGGLPDAGRFADQTALDALADELAKDAGPLDLTAIHGANLGELSQHLRSLGETIFGLPPRRALVEQLFAWAAREKRTFVEKGLLDLTDSGHGFVVHQVNSYRQHLDSTYVPAALVKRHGLRRGQELELLIQPPQAGERCPSAVRVLGVMGTTSEEARNVTVFEELTPYYPTSRILVEAPEIHKDISMRAVDLLTPIGFGQRGLIVAPPRTGKTVLLQNIANSISHNFPEATLILLLIDERPEEVTDFKRHTKGEVVSSTFDESPESHVHAAEMVIERARRLVELGKHVVILLDSITRLARAYNALAGNGGKTMSGGLESNALQRPKRFFGSARNIEGGGSITILATALVDTNSRMDEVIFEEFKGTGNMELHLDRGLSDKRIFPAINIDRSGTRKEELIYHPDEMLRVYGLRRAMQGIPPVEAMDMFIQRLKKTRTNAEFLLSLNR